jgi:hypothetical protein
MAFRVTGEFWITGHHASVTWAEGALSGDLVVIARLKGLARRYARQGRAIGPPPGGGQTSAYLQDAESALHLMLEVFRHRTVEVSGDVPRPAAVMPGVFY